jgi:hypothetical protein
MGQLVCSSLLHSTIAICIDIVIIVNELGISTTKTVNYWARSLSSNFPLIYFALLEYLKWVHFGCDKSLIGSRANHDKWHPFGHNFWQATQCAIFHTEQKKRLRYLKVVPSVVSTKLIFMALMACSSIDTFGLFIYSTKKCLRGKTPPRLGHTPPPDLFSQINKDPPPLFFGASKFRREARTFETCRSSDVYNYMIFYIIIGHRSNKIIYLILIFVLKVF